MWHSVLLCYYLTFLHNQVLYHLSYPCILVCKAGVEPAVFQTRSTAVELRESNPKQAVTCASTVPPLAHIIWPREMGSNHLALPRTQRSSVTRYSLLRRYTTISVVATFIKVTRSIYKLLVYSTIQTYINLCRLLIHFELYNHTSVSSK